jgi:NADH:ubiquinone oxidoreductase subunit 6 (subunit J)
MNNFQFIGLVLIIVYVGAIAMLFLYMIMLISEFAEGQEDTENMRDEFGYISSIIGILSLASYECIIPIIDKNLDLYSNPVEFLLNQSDIVNIGLTLYSQHGSILLTVGFFLFIAMIISVDVANSAMRQMTR